MADYLLIESRDPFDGSCVETYYDLAADLAREGHQVVLFLVENGVLPARATARAENLSATVKAGVEVLADEFSLRERGIGTNRLREGVRPSPLERVIDELGAGAKALWH